MSRCPFGLSLQDSRIEAKKVTPVSMKRPVVDYRGLRLRNITSSQYRHVLLLLIWVFYFSCYFLTENLIPAAQCHPMHCALDDMIPFCEWFILPYVGWYALVFFTLAYFFFYDVEDFSDVSKYILVTQVVAMVCYVLYPTRQDLRPETFANENVLTAICGFLYSFDTNTGVCPSLHVAYSLGIASTWCKRPETKRNFKAFIVVAVVVICLSTMFVKQHSAIDVLAALPLGLLAEILVYGRKYWKPKLTI